MDLNAVLVLVVTAVLLAIIVALEMHSRRTPPTQTSAQPAGVLKGQGK
jgi:hypothetical protein